MNHIFIDVTMTSHGNKPQMNVFSVPPPQLPAEAPLLPAASVGVGVRVGLDPPLGFRTLAYGNSRAVCFNLRKS